MKNKMILVPLLFVLFLTGSSAAQASPLTIRLETSTDGIVFSDLGSGLITDNQAFTGLTGDMTSTVNSILFTGSMGGFTFTSLTAKSQPGAQDVAKLTLGATVSAPAGGYLRLTTTKDITSAYSGATSTALTNVGMLLINSTVVVESSVVKSGVTTAFTPVSATGGGGAGNTFVFSDTQALGPLSLGESIILVTQATFNISATGSARLTTDEIKVVPEPGSLMLITSGVIGMAAAVRRRKNRRSRTAS